MYELSAVSQRTVFNLTVVNFFSERDLRIEILQGIRDQIFMVPRSTKIHFEMASYTEEKLLNLVKEDIVPFSDSLGMNEQVHFNIFSCFATKLLVFISRIVRFLLGVGQSAQFVHVRERQRCHRFDTESGLCT